MKRNLRNCLVVAKKKFWWWQKLHGKKKKKSLVFSCMAGSWWLTIVLDKSVNLLTFRLSSSVDQLAKTF